MLAPWTARSQVVINEVLAENIASLVNDNSYPDWVELYNTSAQDLDLSDWSLTDNLTQARKFVFPAGTTLRRQGFLLVFCDNNTNSPGIHAGFNLNDKGEAIALYNSLASGSVLQDSVTFGLQLPDVSLARAPDFTGSFRPAGPTPEALNQVLPSITSTNLRINEWLARPSSGDDWFELFNPETNIVDLSGLVWSDQTAVPPTNRALPALSFIAPLGFLQFFADDLNNTDFDHVDFALGGGGDRITLFSADQMSLIDRVDFGPQTNNVSQGRLQDGATNIVFFAAGRATPAASNFQLLTDIVISEVLTHTDPPLEDAIELQNTTSNPLNISFWWLSNSREEPKKFRIPNGTVLPAFGFKVFYEFAGVPGGFNPNGQGTGRSFTLNSAHGDEVFLYSAADDASGTLTGFRLNRDFGPAENGVSFGRYLTSEGKTEFTALSRRTFGVDTPATLEQFRSGLGLSNASPRVGPLVLNEIMYHPPDILIDTNRLDDSLNEYIEIHNRTNRTVFLYDTNGLYRDGTVIYANGATNTWRLRGEVDFDFPTNVNLEAGNDLVVVNFNPITDPAQSAEFRLRYGLAPEAQIFGPYKGKLSNSEATVELLKPDPPQSPAHPDAGFVPYILVDRVRYSDNTPWPSAADGTGLALQRVKAEEYGNDPINWTAAVPTPGREYFRIASVAQINGALVLCFEAAAGSSYTVQRNSALTGTAWTKVVDFPAQATSAYRCVTNAIASDSGQFYRVVSPIQP